MDCRRLAQMLSSKSRSSRQFVAYEFLHSTGGEGRPARRVAELLPPSSRLSEEIGRHRSPNGSSPSWRRVYSRADFEFSGPLSARKEIGDGAPPLRARFQRLVIQRASKVDELFDHKGSLRAKYELKCIWLTCHFTQVTCLQGSRRREK